MSCRELQEISSTDEYVDHRGWLPQSIADESHLCLHSRTTRWFSPMPIRAHQNTSRILLNNEPAPVVLEKLPTEQVMSQCDHQDVKDDLVQLRAAYDDLNQRTARALNELMIAQAQLRQLSVKQDVRPQNRTYGGTILSPGATAIVGDFTSTTYVYQESHQRLPPNLASVFARSYRNDPDEKV